MRIIFGFFAALCVLFAVRGVAGGEQPEGPYYEVRSGDTLYSIAHQFGSTVQTLQDANGITDPYILAIGQRLLLPGYVGINGLLGTHPLRPGENLRTLSLQLGTDRSVLLQLNRIVNPAALYLYQPLVHLVPEQVESVRTGRFMLATSADTLLGLALRVGRSPFELGLLNGWNAQHSIVPGEYVYLPGEQPLGSFPAPFESISLAPEHPVQGQTVVITVASSLGAILSGSFAEGDIKFAALANENIGLFGINAMAVPGVYPLILRARTAEGHSMALEMRIPVAGAGYQLQRIVLVPQKAQLLLDGDARDEEDAVIERAVTGFRADGEWEGQFRPPVPTDYITTPFGLRRSYNGSAFRTFHGGVDFGAVEGTPIYAPAGGLVVLAEELRIRGKATLIDHGRGVYTGYWHQSELVANVGQRVEVGEIIGHVGDSGLSTGTHLHWEVWVNGTQVDPLEWLRLNIP